MNNRQQIQNLFTNVNNQVIQTRTYNSIETIFLEQNGEYLNLVDLQITSSRSNRKIFGSSLNVNEHQSSNEVRSSRRVQN